MGWNLNTSFHLLYTSRALVYKQPTVSSPILSSAISMVSCRYYSPSFLNMHHLKLQLQEAVSGNPPDKLAREDSSPSKKGGNPQIFTLPHILQVQFPSFLPGSLAYFLFWIILPFCLHSKGTKLTLIEYPVFPLAVASSISNNLANYNG